MNQKVLVVFDESMFLISLKKMSKTFVRLNLTDEPVNYGKIWIKLFELN